MVDTHETAPRGRRAQQRRETSRALSEAALTEITEHGAVALSLRRVARRLGMSPAGLYRYVDSREDLLTRLIEEAYDDLADHLLVATSRPVPTDPRRVEQPVRPQPTPPVVVDPDAAVEDRLRAVATAYRHWGVTHAHQFGLLYGDPIPGYAAPPGGVTVVAMGRVGEALGAPLIDAYATGRLRRPPPLPDGLTTTLAVGMPELGGRDTPPDLAAMLLLSWGRLHGQVSLEVFGHHTWLFPDGCAALYRLEVDRLIADVLMPA